MRRGATEEISNLKPGMDFRRPEYRREVFLRFYEFNLRYRVQPGCVHYTLPYIVKREGMDRETALWFVFLCSNTMNVVSGYTLWRAAPTLRASRKLGDFYRKHYDSLGWDTDRRYDKKHLIESVESYLSAVGETGGAATLWFDGLRRLRPENTWSDTWKAIRASFATFGRMTTFSFMEQLRCIGEPFECPSLYLEDISGSRSHRNGLAKVLGRDDLDFHKSNPTFDGKYSAEMIKWLTEEGRTLLQEVRARVRKKPGSLIRDATYLTLESTLCTFKGWFRKNRRYPNVYNDILYERIKFAERRFPKANYDIFWEARRATLPAYLRLEDTPADPGLKPVKMNWFRETGQVIMIKDPAFRNDFNTAVERGEKPTCIPSLSSPE